MAVSTKSQNDLYTGSQEALVSVIIPTYNRPIYLKQAIESAVRQTYQNIEIIVSDNCSPENPQAIVENFQDSRIRFWRNAKNLGMCVNTTNAFKKARGKYVASLHDDDIWEEDFLEKLVPPLEANPDVALAFCDHYIINEAGAIDYPETEKCTRLNHRDRLKEGVYQPFCKLGIIEGAVSPAIAAVIRKDAVDWDNIQAEIGGEWDTYISYLCCRSGQGAYYYPERLTRHRLYLQSDSFSSSKKAVGTKLQLAKNQIFCYERLMEDERLEEFKPCFKQRWAYATTSIGIDLLRTKQPADAHPYFLSALGQHLNLRTLAALILSFTPKSFASRF
jgi:glycosyltransferase involved in cell wall biosynthesis